MIDVINCKVNAAREAAAEEKRAALIARLQPHFDADEAAMFERGYLNLHHVERRLDKEAIKQFEDKAQPPEITVNGPVEKSPESVPSSRKEWRFMRRIETRSGQRLWRVGMGVFQTELTTADGRTIYVQIKDEDYSI